MTLTFVRLSPSHYLPRKYGLDAKFLLPSSDERRRRINISNLKYFEFHKNLSTRASSSWTENPENNNNNNNNYVTSRLIIPHRKKEIVTVQSYSGDEQQLDSDIPRHAQFTNLLRAIYQFTRPFIVKFAIIDVISAAILPLTSLAQVNPAFLVGLLQALIVNVLVRVYIAGINQIYDVELDKINKPHLPIASGALSMKLAVAIVAMCFLGSAALGLLFRSPPLFYGALFSCLFGTLYSVELPLMRWKRYPILVSTVVFMLNAVGTPFSTFFHIQKYVLGSPIMFFTKSLIFQSCFVGSAVISLAFLKDIHDILGDKKHGFQTMVVRLGAERVFWICVSASILTYGCAIGVGITSSSFITKLVTIPGHLSLACLLLYRALSVDLSVEGSAEDLHMFMWKLLCAELLFMVPFVH